jgi:hypothetical protein
MRYKRVVRGAPIVAPILLVAISLTAPAQGATNQAAGTASRASSAQSGQRPLTPALAKKLSRDVTDKVIVVLRNQLPGLPDTPANSARRAADVTAIQHGVRSELTATHARDVKSISLVNAIAATVSPGEAKRLAGNPAVAEVTRDLPIPLVSSLPKLKPDKHPSGIKPLPGACPTTKNGVQLDPEAVENIHAATQSGKNSAQGLGYTGAGVKVAWIADGIDINNPDFIRANGKHVFVDYQDFSGTGTNAPTNGGEAFLDASSIAAQGRHVYNVQNYGIGLNVPCRIRILGVAPGASLVGLNVFGSSNVAFNSVFLEAVNYAVTVDHVNVINESFGANVFPDIASLDLTRLADDAAVKAGVTVVASSGDAGVTSTIGSPATDPKVLSAGASTTYRSYAQTGVGGITVPGVTGWIDNNISGLSSGGFTPAGRTVDVVAPGDLNWALCTPKPALFGACTDFSNKPAAVELQGGTSEASPLTAGVAALVIQAYRAGHHGHTPSPALVRQIIISTAQDIGAPAEQQGAGMIDAYQAVLAARSFAGTTLSKQGHAVLAGSTQLNAVGSTSSLQVLNDTLTNDGTSPVTLHLSSRTLSAPTVVDSETLHLAASQGYSAEVTFHVATGQARLNASVTLPQGGADLSLVAPNGNLAEFNLPQGPGGYANAQVANPAAGTWTALIQGIPDLSPSSISAPFLATTSTWQPFGTLSTNSITLTPGETSSPFHLSVNTPSQPGDQAGSIVVRDSSASPAFTDVTTIPVIVRALIATPSPTTTFTGTLTGGNGRGANTGQSNFYEVDVPPATAALNATVSTGNPNNTLFVELVDPSGEVVSAAQNGLLAINSGGSPELVPETGAQVHAVAPAPGRWTLVVDFYNSVSGTAATQPFTVNMDVSPVTATENGLPTSTSDMFTPGVAEHASVTVTNNGTVPEEYFIDARTNHQVTLNLAAQTTSSLQLPNLIGIVPEYLIPTLTTAISAKVSAPAANFFDLSYPFGDPDLISSTAKTSSVSFSPAAADIPNGDWTVTPFLKGPDGAKGAKTVNANVTMTATTKQIDPAVSDPTGDLWSGSTNPNAGFTPYVVLPGQSVTIPVTITAHGTLGQEFQGTIYIADTSFNPGQVTYNGIFGIFPTASNVAAFNYTYSIGS